MRKYFITLILIITFQCYIYSSGFRIVEYSASALGLANAVVANVDDASAVVFNSAALADLKGNNLSVGLTIISPSTSFSGSVNEDMKNNHFFPPNIYFSTDKLLEKFVLAVGFYVPYGLGTEWKSNGNFKYESTLAEINTKCLTTVISEKLNDKFSCGIGLNYYFSEVNIDKVGPYSLQGLTQFVPPKIWFDGDISMEHDKGEAWGWNISLLYKFNKKLKIGLNYVSKFSINYSNGDLMLLNYPVLVVAPDTYIQTDVKSTGSAKMNYPALAALGIGYIVDDKIMLEFDINWTKWEEYKNLTIVTPISTTSVVKNWKNVYSYRIGLKYSITKLSTLKLGFAIDESPIPKETYDPMLPGGDRCVYAIGYSRELNKKIAMDLAYQYLKFSDETVTGRNALLHYGKDLNGTYKTSVNIFSINVNYNF